MNICNKLNEHCRKLSFLSRKCQFGFHQNLFQQFSAQNAFCLRIFGRIFKPAGRFDVSQASLTGAEAEVVGSVVSIFMMMMMMMMNDNDSDDDDNDDGDDDDGDDDDGDDDDGVDDDDDNDDDDKDDGVLPCFSQDDELTWQHLVERPLMGITRHTPSWR